MRENGPIRYEYDMLVIGSGIAGLSSAITAAESGKRVAVLSKGETLSDTNTGHAQGGIVGASPADDADRLARDIFEAGSRVNSTDAVGVLVDEGPDLTRSFLKDKIGVPFTLDDDGAPALTMEAAHSVRRIYYAKDRTGNAIQRALVAYACTCDRIEMFERHTAVDFITNAHNSLDPQQKYRKTRVIGAYSLDSANEVVHAFFSPIVVLATGGLGNLFLHTSNPVGATGDGIAMAYRIGVEILNAEYVQFHPTVLFHRDVKRFLISEAVRGEGARLINHAGENFMDNYAPEHGDLAPRDEVARAIYREMEREDMEYVRLDATRIRDVSLEDRFPAIYAQCREVGIDMRTEPIPVVPGAHYFCGGVKVDLVGRTTVSGLLAAGEVACTGVHGANRLASVSLLEGLVWGIRCGRFEDGEVLDSKLIESIPDWREPDRTEAFDEVLLKQDFRSIQSTMWNYAGIIRSRKRLLRAFADLDYLSHRVEQFYRGAHLTSRIIELRNSVLSATIIVRSALANPDSIGCHYVEP